jgi:hypothetical protein
MDTACYSKIPNYTLSHSRRQYTCAHLRFYAGQIGSVTNVSRQPMGHTFQGQAAQECRPETSITNYQSTLCKIPEVRRSHLHQGGNLKSLKGDSSLKIIMGRAFYTSDGNNECSQNFGQKSFWKETNSRCGYKVKLVLMDGFWTQ